VDFAFFTVAKMIGFLLVLTQLNITTLLDK